MQVTWHTSSVIKPGSHIIELKGIGLSRRTEEHKLLVDDDNDGIGAGRYTVYPKKPLSSTLVGSLSLPGNAASIVVIENTENGGWQISHILQHRKPNTLDLPTSSQRVAVIGDISHLNPFNGERGSIRKPGAHRPPVNPILQRQEKRNKKKNKRK